MSVAEELDKRLVERKVRQGQLSQENLERNTKALPDLAQNVSRPDEEELERVREELELEQVARDRRIERALTEPSEPVAPPPVVPFELEE